MKTLYPAIITPEKVGGYCAQFVDLAEAYTEGETIEETLFNAAEVLTLTLEGRMQEGLEIPEPSARVARAHYIAPDAKTQAALLMRQARGEMSYAKLARALQTSWDVARRLEDPNHWPSLRALDRAASAMGKRLVLSLA